MIASSGFITTTVDTMEYRLGAKKPEEGWWNIPSFDRLCVKSVAETHRCPTDSRRSELAVTRGRDGIVNEVDA